MQKILVIQTAFLGDVILATPLISELRRLFPDARIDMLVKKGNESLVNTSPKIDNVYIFDKSHGKYRHMLELTRLFRKTAYDRVINLQRFGSSGLITFLSGAKIKVGFDKNPFAFCYTRKVKHEIGNGTHEVTRNLSLIADLGAQTLVRPELFPSGETIAKTKQYKDAAYVCLAPASVWFTKQLPREKWLDLIETLDPSQTVYLLGGPADHSLCETIRTDAHVLLPHLKVVNLAGELNIMESVALIADAKRAYVNDSGPLHMASAVNCPTTAFFCSTVPGFGFGPLAEDSVVREIDFKLDCRPCGLHGYKACPLGHFKCSHITM